MLNHHGQLHSAERRAFRALFSPRAIARYSEHVTDIVDATLDRLEEGPADLLTGYAFPIPLAVVGTLLGLDDLDPTEVHGRWDDMMSTYGELDETGLAAAERSTRELLTIIEAAIEAPKVGTLTAAMLEAGDASGLDPQVVAADLLLVLGAGFDTTMALIANTLAELLQHGGLVGRDDPDELAGFVEEVLRMQPSVQWVGRVATNDLEVSAVTIPAGSRLVLSLADANRDPTRFAAADHFDASRSPNPHLAFGAGAHFCLGAHLGRLEAATAVARLAGRYPRTRLSGEIQWREHALLRCPVALPAELEA
jgi:cytochrome P450